MPIWTWLACAPDPAGDGPGPHSGTGTAADFLWDDARVLLVPDRVGVTFFGRDGEPVLARTWTELVGDCDRCGGEGASDDGDGLLLTFTTDGPTSDGAVARLDGDGALDWRVDGLGFPHDAERDPADGTVIVVEVTRSIVSWIAGDGASAERLRVLDRGVAGWEAGLPNGAERFDWEGRSYLLLSHRGLAVAEQAAGFLSLWDVTTPGAPTRVWRFPERGHLRTPHGAVLRRFDGHLWLLYAHSDGTAASSTVGFAWADDPTLPPRYVADLQPVGAEAPFDFLRGVELTTDGSMWLTDSGPGSGASTVPLGRVLSATLPAGLVPSAASGAFGDLTLIDVEPAPFASGLTNPFEGWLWTATFR